jgi:hypothetical protein
MNSRTYRIFAVEGFFYLLPRQGYKLVFCLDALECKALGLLTICHWFDNDWGYSLDLMHNTTIHLRQHRQALNHSGT